MHWSRIGRRIGAVCGHGNEPAAPVASMTTVISLIARDHMACPYCGAERGQRCRTKSGNTAPEHPTRVAGFAEAYRHGRWEARGVLNEAMVHGVVDINYRETRRSR